MSRRLAAVALAVPPPRPLCLAQQRKEKRRWSSGKQCEKGRVFDLLGRDTHTPEKGEVGASGVAGDARPAIPHPGRDPNPSHREKGLARGEQNRTNQATAVPPGVAGDDLAAPPRLAGGDRSAGADD